MAGRGQRFVDQGYKDPKPLIDIAGRPMIEQALRTLPPPTTRTLVAQREHAHDARFQASVARLGKTRVVELDRVTEGQACTAELGLEGIDLTAPILFAPCDAGYVYDPAAWRAGRDPQLEKAVEWLLDELKKNPPKEYKRPPYPDYHKGTPLGRQ